jgi:hypothetical protein
MWGESRIQSAEITLLRSVIGYVHSFRQGKERWYWSTQCVYVERLLCAFKVRISGENIVEMYFKLRSRVTRCTVNHTHDWLKPEPPSKTYPSKKEVAEELKTHLGLQVLFE